MEGEGFIRAVFALVFVLALIGLMGWGLRRWGAGRLAGRLQEGRRLRLIEQLYLDPKRRLALISFDGREHLLLLGEQHTLEIGVRKPERKRSE